jgi:MYXO-CTERM domain-containing protein
LFTAVTAGAARANVISNFDAGSESWSLLDLVSTSGGPTLSVARRYPTITWAASGGNPGGFVYGPDDRDNTLVYSAPAAFLGNKSSYAGGTVSFDIKDVKDTSAGALGTTNVPLILMKTGGSKALFQTASLGANSTYTRASFTLSPGSTWKLNAFNGALATSADFSDVLGDLGAVYVLSDYYIGNETASLDNVRLTAVSGAPEPGTAVLALLAAAATLGRRRRRPSLTPPSPSASAHDAGQSSPG